MARRLTSRSTGSTLTTTVESSTVTTTNTEFGIMADNYTITGQQDILDLNNGGVPVRSVEVSFETYPHKIKGTVRIPIADFTAAKVHDEVTARADTAEAVMGL